MLFVGQVPFTADTASVLRRDLDVFAALLERHCAPGVFASRHKAHARRRAEWVLALLHKLHELLDTLLRPPTASGAAEEAEERDRLGTLVVQLCAHAANLSRAVLLRLLDRCQRRDLRGAALNKRRAGALAGHDRAIAQPSSSSPLHSLPHKHSTFAPLGGDGGGSEGPLEPPRFCATVEEALQLGRRFSMWRLLELQHSATRKGR